MINEEPIQSVANIIADRMGLDASDVAQRISAAVNQGRVEFVELLGLDLSEESITVLVPWYPQGSDRERIDTRWWMVVGFVWLAGNSNGETN